MIKQNNNIIDFDILKTSIETEKENACQHRIAQKPIKTKDNQKAIIIKTNQLFYSVYDLLDNDGENFIKNAYRCLLKRDIDTASLKAYHARLSIGMGKSSLLLRLSLSEEGRKQAVVIEGIWGAWINEVIGKHSALKKLQEKYQNLNVDKIRHFQERINTFINKLVFVKEVSHWFLALFGLGRQNIRSQKVFKYLHTFEKRQTKLNEKIERKLQKAHLNIQGMQQRIDEIAEQLQGHQQQIDKVPGHEGTINALQEQLQHLKSQLASYVYELRQIEHDRHTEISTTSPAREIPAANQIANDSTDNEKSDRFYLAFENQFRGTAEAIKKRQEIYLSYLKSERQRELITQQQPILDLGCGRGEWLELLTENNFAAQGIDISDAMIHTCKEKNLSVQHADGLAFLQQQEANSLAAISGFHIIEHLPFAVLLDLFDECLRVLIPGGLIIFETPNPENVLVGSHSFYYDVTHRNPLPPLLIEFLAQHRGFDDVEIKRLNPYPEHMMVPSSEGIAGEHINRFFYGAQDYAVIARKN